MSARVVSLAFGLALLAAPLARAADGGAPAVTAEAPDPDAPTVAAHADRTQAHVGDPVHLEVVAIAKSTIPVNLPSTLELGAFTLLDRKESEQNLGDGRVKHTYTLSAAAYEPGQKELPAIEVTYLGPRGDVRTVRTAPVPIKIDSLIANEPEPALKDAAPPVTVIEENLWPAYIAGGLVAAGLGALIALAIIRRLRARRGERAAPPPRPAHEVALEKLDSLGMYGFLEDADNRPFYFAVSEVIREYLGGRYGFDSLELTTDELMAELERQAGRELVLGEVRGWLSACDLVKFAKISPSAAEARGALESALRIVTTTRPVAAPVASAADAAEALHA
ncbi:MAG TPA: BatD family protein [Polyangia bacterium]|nr:BatD family protein [Polyangia bacterium]